MVVSRFYLPYGSDGPTRPPPCQTSSLSSARARFSVKHAKIGTTTVVIGVRLVAYPCKQSRLVRHKTQTFCLEVTIGKKPHVRFHERIVSVGP